MCNELFCIGYPSTPPRNLSLLSSSIKEGILSVNLTWIPPEYSHGYIDYYGVEFYYNDTEIPLIVEKRTEVSILCHVHNPTNILLEGVGIKCVIP